ncbi:hypothetical protein SAMN05421803_101895 [Nocardiopsis flavescens]|uniref:Uncharacterized protein n=1 Tax=Nocardiopsis flavescens TaxID=758803 RepID=A0A1M6D2L8_9ACTN|nr:hypothetical protein [Nocardiopsis flavescens]SHI67248.1 hypothetical protein SAMN05421803_101895 [Nocardiopsis flavescens]
MNDRYDPWTGAGSEDPHGFDGPDGPDGLDGLGGLDGDAGAWSAPDPAPGAPLPPFRPSLALERTRFAIGLDDASTATVDVDHTSGRASLYRDGRHVRTADMPVRFPVGTAGIEVAASRYGMQRIHLVGADGGPRRLEPAPGTPEHWRARLSRRHPGVGRALAVGAVVVLAVNLLLLAPQLLESATHLPLWADRLTPFVSPVDLPAWANTALTATAALAGIERALTFRHHRLLDAETDGIAD